MTKKHVEPSKSAKGGSTIVGTSGNDKLVGTKGNDKIFGGAGDDKLIGGKGNDKLYGGSGNDKLFGGSGNDKLIGGKGDDKLYGGSGKDKINGGGGDDVIHGGAGADVLIGGKGNDVFVYLSAAESNLCAWDRILDFKQGHDKIDLSALLGATDLIWGNQTATINGAWFNNVGSKTFVFADTTGDGKADLKIELKHTPGLQLKVSDFIGVSNALSASDDAYATNEDNVLNVSVLTGVLANDGASSGPLSAQLVSGPANGSIELNSDGSFTYTPNADFFGADSFTYRTFDGTANSNVATVNITVNPVNDAPSFAAADPVAVNEDGGAQTVAGWAAFNAGAPNESAQTATYTVSNITNPDLFAVAPAVGSDGTLTYTPASNVFGESFFDVFVTDNGGTGGGGTDTSPVQTFRIVVNSVNDAPSFVAADPVAVDEDSGAQSIAGWAAFNAGPANESTQTATYTVANVTNPGLFLVAPAVAPDGTLTYTPTPDAFGESFFDVFVSDSGGTANGGVDTSAAQNFRITVNPVNDAPVITSAPQEATVTEVADNAENENATLHAVGGAVTFNDVDPGDAHSASFVAGGAGYLGTFTLDPVAGNSVGWAFNVQDSDLDFLLGGETRVQTYTVTVDDGNGGSAEQVVTITINGSADALFTGNEDIVDFNALLAVNYTASTQYDALGGNDVVVLPASPAAATAAGFDQAQTFLGGNGDDRITMSIENPLKINAGPGNDTLVLAGNAGGGVVVIDLSATDQYQGIDPLPEPLVQTGFENLDASGLTNGSIFFFAAGASTRVVGSSDDDTIILGSGPGVVNVVKGGPGHDTIESGFAIGDDTFVHTFNLNGALPTSNDGFDSIFNFGANFVPGLGSDKFRFDIVMPEGSPVPTLATLEGFFKHATAAGSSVISLNDDSWSVTTVGVSFADKTAAFAHVDIYVNDVLIG
jgi:VCBS repeat-containing protein